MHTATGRVISRTYEHSFWTLDSAMPATATLEQHVQAILDIVGPVSKAIRQIPGAISKRIYCTVIPGGAIPTLEVQHDTLERVSALGCGLVIDVLYVDEAEE